jgi:hypothetical protein
MVVDGSGRELRDEKSVVGLLPFVVRPPYRPQFALIVMIADVCDSKRLSLAGRQG